MFSALAEGVTEVTGFLNGADCEATANALAAMGVQIERLGAQHLKVHGVGLNGLVRPKNALDVGNSGTSMRLLAGILAGQAFDSVLTGDRSLQKRPMGRVADPLGAMGAKIELQDDGTAPMRIQGQSPLRALQYHSPVASAQVKSCVLLAGLYGDGETSVTEPLASRDHSERMLAAYGADISVDGLTTAIRPGELTSPGALDVPSDISSAAFFLVGAATSAGSDLLLKGVGMNPTRDGVVKILQAMGADITISNARVQGGEPVADLRVRGSDLMGIEIDPALVPSAIDEFPAILIAAACATGVTTLTDAEELRVKESDRLAVMCGHLRALGIELDEHPDGCVIQGGQMQGGLVDSHDDHRIAMAFAMAGLRANAEIVVQNCDNVDTSFPGFAALASQAGLNISATK